MIASPEDLIESAFPMVLKAAVGDFRVGCHSRSRH
jgi:hypothetical protein